MWTLQMLLSYAKYVMWKMLLQILLQLGSNNETVFSVCVEEFLWLEYVIPCFQGFEPDTELNTVNIWKWDSIL